MDRDDTLHRGALAIATEIHEEDHDLIERADVRNGSIHVVPSGNLSGLKRGIVEANVDSWIGDRPWAFAEWWTPMAENDSVHAVFSTYWITGGQVTDEQLSAYDDYVTHVERTGEPPSSNCREDWDTSIEVAP